MSRASPQSSPARTSRSRSSVVGRAPGSKKSAKVAAVSKFPEPPPFEYVPIHLPDPHTKWVKLDLRLVDPQGIGFTRVTRCDTLLGTVRRWIQAKHGFSASGVELFKGKVIRSKTLLTGDEDRLHDLGIEGGPEADPPVQVVWYDFDVPDIKCPLLRRPPETESIMTLQRERQAIKAAQEAKEEHEEGLRKEAEKRMHAQSSGTLPSSPHFETSIHNAVEVEVLEATSRKAAHDALEAARAAEEAAPVILPKEFTVLIDSAEEVQVADDNGYSDPFVVLTFQEKEYRTQPVEMTINPTWNESFSVKLRDEDDEDEDERKPVDTLLSFKIYDEDLFAHDPLGHAVVDLENHAKALAKTGAVLLELPITVTHAVTDATVGHHGILRVQLIAAEGADPPTQ